jgi:hypothetical protein
MLGCKLYQTLFQYSAWISCSRLSTISFWYSDHDLRERRKFGLFLQKTRVGKKGLEVEASVVDQIHLTAHEGHVMANRQVLGYFLAIDFSICAQFYIIFIFILFEEDGPSLRPSAHTLNCNKVTSTSYLHKLKLPALRKEVQKLLS